MELLKNSIAMQEQMLSCKGFLVIGYSLEKVNENYDLLLTLLLIFFICVCFGQCGNVEHVLLPFSVFQSTH